MERAEVIERLRSFPPRPRRTITSQEIHDYQAAARIAADLLENRWSGFFEEELSELRAGTAQRHEGGKAVPGEYRRRAGRLAAEIRQELDRREVERSNYRGPGIYRASGNEAEYVVAGILATDVVLRGVGSEHLTTLPLTDFNQRMSGKPRFEWVREA